MRQPLHVQFQLEECSGKTCGTSSQFDITATRQASSPDPALEKESIIEPDMTKLVAGKPALG